MSVQRTRLTLILYEYIFLFQPAELKIFQADDDDEALPDTELKFVNSFLFFFFFASKRIPSAQL